MSCMLLCGGEDFDLSRFLLHHPIETYKTWRKGDLNRRGELITWNGFSALASGASINEFERQVSEATKFLQISSVWLSELKRTKGLSHVSLDFAFEIPVDRIIPMIELPKDFVKIAARHAIALRVSIYPCLIASDDIECEVITGSVENGTVVGRSGSVNR